LLVLLAFLLSISCRSEAEPHKPAPDPSPDSGAAEPEPEPEPETPETPERPTGNARAAADVQLDGFGIGTKLSELMERGAPYDKPCDLDRLADVKRSVVVYTGKECRGQVFPDGTTVLFMLSLAPGEEGDTEKDLAQPIEAVAWLGGDYFRGKTNLPVEVGAKKADIDVALGPPTTSFQIGTAFEPVTDDPDPKPIGDPLLAHQHPGDIWSVTRSGLAVGFVVGKMPADAEDEQWEGVTELYFSYVVD
jgi:hypothetical protein